MHGADGVRLPGFGGHFRLLFRSYLVLVAGLLAVAIVLDFAFERLQSATAPAVEPGIEATLRLVESELAASPAAERNRVAAAIGEAAGIPVRLLARDDVADFGSLKAGDDAIRVLGDAEGNTYYLFDAPDLGALIYLGPVTPPARGTLFRLVPPLFYLSIFVLVGLWLRPLLKDIDRMTSSASRFAADYRVPLRTAEQTTQLTSLARSLDAMSARIGGLIQSQKELIAAMSHEMRTPLARIRFALAVMEKDADPPLRRRLADVNSDVQEIDALIASMLDYARLDHPELRMNWQSVPIEPWLKLQRDRFELPDTDIELDFDDAPDVATMDPRLMALAVSNLLGNAVRYGRGRIRLAFEELEERFRIRVEDDGDGIPYDARETVFKAFTRVDDSRARDTGGYGLGLAIVARVAALHGGSATADASEALGGANFAIEWPRDAAGGGIDRLS